MPQLHLEEGTRIGETNDPTAIKGTLGWMLMDGKNSVNKINTNRLVTNENINLDRQLEKFWTIESYGTHSIESSKVMFNKEKRRALDILEKTTVKNRNRYEVGLLWKNEEMKLPYNTDLVVNRFKSTENKFNRNPEIATKYKGTVKSYIESAYARKLSKEKADGTSNITNYIPHHSVVNPNKPGKLRVAYDAGAQHRNTSLTQNLIKGPDFLNNLVGVLMRFRKGKIAATSDIQQMFHQIRVRKSDQDALRFVCRESQLKPMEDYIMCVHVFGKLDSPCIANCTLKKTPIDQKAKYNYDVIDAVHKNFYMDDYLGSYRIIDLAKETVVSVTKLLSEGGFRLTKWISNYDALLDVLPQSEIGKFSIEDSSIKNETEKILRIMWNYKKDTSNVKHSNKSYPNTKRGILSHIRPIFDPLCLLVPFLLEPKLIIQQL